MEEEKAELNWKRIVIAVLMLIAFLFLAIALVSAIWSDDALTIDKTGASYTTDQNLVDNIGYKFTALGNIQIVNVTKTDGVTATKAYLYNGAGTLLATSSFVGNNATFGWNLTALNNYSVTIGSDGAFYNRKYCSYCVSFPLTKTNIRYIHGVAGGTLTIDDQWLSNLDSITTASSAIILNSPNQSYESPYPAILFNCSANAPAGTNLVNISLWNNGTGSFAINQTINVTGSLNQTTFRANFSSEGYYSWNCQACSDDGLCGMSSTNRTFKYSSSPFIAVIKPLSSSSSLDVNITVNATSGFATNLSYCFWNISRGASTEISNTAFNMSQDPLSANATVSGYASYSLNIWCNNTLNYATITYFPFTISAGSSPGIPGSSAGGGGFFQQLTTKVKAQICIPTEQPFADAYKSFVKDSSWKNLVVLWRSYLNYSLCKGGASIIGVV